jgi:hypothetical protein
MDNFSTQMELAQPHGALPQVSRPLWPISCIFLILITWIFITLLVSSLSPSHLWRFKIHETYKPGSAEITHHVGSGDCPFMGCSQALTILFTPKSIVPHPVEMYINLPYICFLFDQTQPYCKKVRGNMEAAHIGAGENIGSQKSVQQVVRYVPIIMTQVSSSTSPIPGTSVGRMGQRLHVLIR